MKIAHYNLPIAVALAPMAGITDNPFRRLCRELGATWTIGEMISGDPTLRHTSKTLNRTNYSNEAAPIVTQIAGGDPQKMVAAAAYHIELGANIIDINMGCPAKKVCHAQAGSALMQDEKLVAEILQAVVKAVDVPITLKTRLGWSDEHLNVLNIAHIAEQEGIAALAIHGRSRTQMYRGRASYDLIAEVKDKTTLPIWVNGDIDSAEKAQQVLKKTRADGVMIGRAAQGNPWLFRDIVYYLEYNELPKPLSFEQKQIIILNHIKAIHNFYGEQQGVKIARKHIHWYLQKMGLGKQSRALINGQETVVAQLDLLTDFLAMHCDVATGGYVINSR